VQRDAGARVARHDLRQRDRDAADDVVDEREPTGVLVLHEQRAVLGAGVLESDRNQLRLDGSLPRGVETIFDLAHAP
jgi:hypothetical protein